MGAGKVLMGQRLAAIVVRVGGRGGRVGVGPAMVARRRRRYWQMEV